MFEFTIHEAAFLNEFKEKIRAYVNKSYQYTMRFLASPVVCDYRDNERLILISVNKSVYQNLYSFLHLNALKVDWNATVNVSGVYLTPGHANQDMAISDSQVDTDGKQAALYDLTGRHIKEHTKPGLYIKGGRKYIK